MVVATILTNTSAALGGAAVALAWMCWACVSGRSVAPPAQPRRQREPKIIRT